MVSGYLAKCTAASSLVLSEKSPGSTNTPSKRTGALSTGMQARLACLVLKDRRGFFSLLIHASHHPGPEERVWDGDTVGLSLGPQAAQLWLGQVL